MGSFARTVKETLNLSTTPTLPSSFHENEVSHEPTTNANSWKEALSTSQTPKVGYLLTKTLVFKPKVAKTQTARLIVVIALNSTATTAAQVSKAAEEKE